MFCTLVQIHRYYSMAAWNNKKAKVSQNICSGGKCHDDINMQKCKLTGRDIMHK